MKETPQPRVKTPDIFQPIADIKPVPEEKKPTYVRHLFETPRQHRGEIVAYSLILLFVILSFYVHLLFTPPIFVCLFWVYYRLCPEKINPTNIVFRNYPIHFYGESNQLLQEWILANPIDPISKMRWGFYYIDEENIVSVPQGSHEANYTNIHRLIRAFCMSKGWAQKSHITKYYELMRSVAPVITTQDDFAILDKIESQIKILTSAKPYRVTAPVIDQLDIKLSSWPSLRKYLCTKITHNVISAAVANRVLRPGVRTTKSVAEHLKLFQDFWNRHTDIKRIEDLDPTPEIFKYAGKKLRKYMDALENMGHHSSNPMYSTFLKIEAAAIEFINKKAVRMITPNNVMFNVTFKNFFSKFEHILLSFKHPRIKLPVFAKGMNYEQRLETIFDYSKHYRYVFPADFKSFDSHHVGPAAEAEIRAYESLGFDKVMANRTIKASHKGVVEYEGIQRCSGDVYTGCGNCFAVGASLDPWTKKSDTAYFCDGDDTLIFTNDVTVYSKITEDLKTYGYELDPVDPIVLDDEHDYAIPFCQVTYCKDKYYIDRERALNKLMNITASNTTRAAEIVLGKLQAIQFYSHFNIDFNVDLSSFINPIEDEDGSLKYKRALVDQIDGLKHLDQYQEVMHVDLRDKSNGIIVEIIENIMSSTKLKLFRHIANMTPEAYRRAVIKNIRHTLDEIVSRTGTFDEETQENMERAERIIESAGPMLASYIMEAEKDRIKELEKPVKKAGRVTYVTPHTINPSVNETDLSELSDFSLDSE
jgi:hypothetical protein